MSDPYPQRAVTVDYTAANPSLVLPCANVQIAFELTGTPDPISGDVEPIDLTGRALHATFCDKRHENPVDLAITVDDPASGRFDVLFNLGDLEITPGTYHYIITMETDVDDKRPIAAGPVTVRQCHQ